MLLVAMERKVSARFATGRRAFTTLFDQGVSSVSNFAMTAVVAHAAGPAGLGAFSIAYAAWLVVAAMHRSLVTDPMIIEGDARNGSDIKGLASGLGAELLLGLAGAACLACAALLALVAGWRAVSLGLFALAPWLPALLAQDYWRGAGFMTRRPSMSLVNDIAFDVVQAGAFAGVLLSHTGSIPLLVSSWGLGGAAGAVVSLVQFRNMPSLIGGAQVLRAHWRLSRWIAGSSAVTWASSQAYIFVAAATLGPAGLGAIKAARTLVSGPAGVLIQAGGSVGLPEATRSYAERGKQGLTRVARQVGFAGFLSFALVGALVAVWGRPLMHLLYGQAFTKFWGAALLFAAAYTVEAFVLGPILVLKAMRRTDCILYADTVELIVSVVVTGALCWAFGVDGAAEATILTYCMGTLVFRKYQRRALLEADRPTTPELLGGDAGSWGEAGLDDAAGRLAPSSAP